MTDNTPVRGGAQAYPPSPPYITYHIQAPAFEMAAVDPYPNPDLQAVMGPPLLATPERILPRDLLG